MKVGRSGVYFHHQNSKHSYDKVLLLGGSENSLNALLPMAACLANKGFDVLALKYYDGAGDFEAVPIEYVESAIGWLKNQANGEKISIVGTSKGAELALLVASVSEHVKKVTAISPTAYVYQNAQGGMQSSWKYNERAIPCIYFFPFLPPIDFFKNIVFRLVGLPQGYYLTYLISRLLNPMKEKARIKVEHIKAEVCLIGGKKDGMWESVWAISRMRELLEKNKGNRNHEYHIYEKGGHIFYTPFIFSGHAAYGGAEIDVMDAGEDAWRKVASFLHR